MSRPPSASLPHTMTSEEQALSATLSKLEVLLDCAMPVSGAPPVDDATIASQKGRILLELSRFSPRDKSTPLPEPIATQVLRVRNRLAEEHRLLKRRLDAAQIISALIAEAFVAEDWDGTYERHSALTSAAGQSLAASGPAPGAGASQRTAINAHSTGETHQ